MPNEIDARSYDELNTALAIAEHAVYKKHVDEIDSYPIVEPTELLRLENPEDYIRLFQLEQLTCKKNEDIFQKLSTVYHAAMSLGSSLIVMVDVAKPSDPAKIYLGIREPLDVNDTEKENKEKLRVSFSALREGLLSNFPGSQVKAISASSELKPKLHNIFSAPIKFVSSVACVASIRDKSKTEQKGFVQGLEKMIDVMRGKTYTAIFIADPISPAQQSDIRNGYESLYSTLSPFRKSTWSYNENESSAVMKSLSHGVTDSVTDSVTHTQSHTIGQTKGTNNSVNIGLSLSGNRAETNTNTTPTSASRIGHAVSAVSGLFSSITPFLTVVYPPAGAAIAGVTAIAAAMQGATKSIAESSGISGGLNAGYSHGWLKSENESDTTSDGTTKSTGKATTDTTTDSTTETKGTGRTLQIENTNKAIEELLKRIETQLERTREGEDYGAYNCGAYFLSGKKEYCLLAANTYRALLLGEGSSVESGAVNVWEDTARVDLIKEYLSHFAQPVFAYPVQVKDAAQYMVCSPGTIVSGLELPLHLGLPTKSVNGLAVVDHAEFGRNPIPPSSASVRLGQLYHMGRVEDYADVLLEKQALTAHTFITGSTGSGKSNTIYTMLNRMCLDESAENRIKFLVIESAKGEYKNAVGTYDGVSVYGTNAKLTPLLRINPFAFPDEIHVLEHIDRLVEVFNACWPMYAAMPAVLKDAIESAYVGCGWNLARSECVVSDCYPTFLDVLKKLPEIMNNSAYSADTKGDYTGALVTRVKSLTNGINGQVFCADDTLSDISLFDENVVIDLSRVGSMETKALIMGVLMIKLQEYRMANKKENNAPLRHITVLEEAHNLLRRTSSEQSQESSNLQGKSVEMLANAIAEMRTYGECIIIADQAPGLLDMAVIRNTNTKIIMRLPDESDRELVGRAAGLNDDQIVELTKLERGVAAVYQDGWLEPVLCKVDKFEGDGKHYEYHPPKDNADPKMDTFFHLMLHGTSDGYELTEEDVEKLKVWINRQDINEDGKTILLNVLAGKGFDAENVRMVLFSLLHGKSLVALRKGGATPESVRVTVDQRVSDDLHISMAMAEEIRKQIFLCAAEQFRDKGNEVQYNELLSYGGVR